MNRYVHALCHPCWDRLFPRQYPAHAVDAGEPEPCCSCGEPTRAGIYVRAEPAKLKCAGAHGSATESQEGGE